MKQLLTFDLDFRLPSVNTESSKMWRNRHKVRRELGAKTMAALTAANVPRETFTEPVIISVCGFYKSPAGSTEPDVDNINIKPVIDTLVNYGLLTDDNGDYVAGIFKTALYRASDYGAKVTIWSANAATLAQLGNIHISKIDIGDQP